ncbi:MAG: dehydrogenase, partial [Christensenella sp.]|nr:dehydrogenase [Christensenella sp.]
MPKSLVVDPKAVRTPGTLTFADIPLNVYQKTLKDVKKQFPEEDLKHIFEDMRLIREFETMLEGIRTVKTYNGIEYSYTGPAHCSHGQEAFAVGEAYVLDTNDYSLGTHRAHAEVLARAMSAIRELPEDELYKIM